MTEQTSSSLEIVAHYTDIVSGIATAVAVFLSWWAIKEMVRQRKQSLQPDIEIEEVKLQVYFQIVETDGEDVKDWMIKFWGYSNPTTEIQDVPTLAPGPMLGLHGTYTIGKKISLKGTAEYFKLELNDWDYKIS